MNKAERAGAELRAMDELAAQDSAVHRMPPLSKLFLTVLYIAVTVSFNKYDFTGLLVMLLFPVVAYQISEIPISTCFYKLRIVMPLVCAVGLFNPFFDRAIIVQIGSVGISGGVVSMLTLMMKGVFCLMASFLLIATTSIEEVCFALRRLAFPEAADFAHASDFPLYICAARRGRDNDRGLRAARTRSARGCTFRHGARFLGSLSCAA